MGEGLAVPPGMPNGAKASHFVNRALSGIRNCGDWPLSRRLAAAVCAVIFGAAFRYYCLGVLEGRLIYITLLPAVALASVLGGAAGRNSWRRSFASWRLTA